jgi:hypothetical protein
MYDSYMSDHAVSGVYACMAVIVSYMSDHAVSGGVRLYDSYMSDHAMS